MRIYIAGCGGMLGKAFYEVFSSFNELKCTDIDVNEDWLTYCDFRDKRSYSQDVENFKPDFLFHLGAYTDLEYCDMNEDDTYDTNVLSVEHAVEITNKLKIPLLYISTAGIFDGAKNTYDDFDYPNPLGIYGKTKFAGEVIVKELSDNYLICRAGWMMGGGKEKDKKFIGKLMKQIMSGTRTLNIVNDKDGTPTYTKDFAENVNLLISENRKGLYNMVCKGQTSRMEVAKYLITLLKRRYNVKINIKEVNSQYFSNEYFSARPDSERLINKRLNYLKLDVMQDWKISLEEYIEEWDEDFK
jgi:dTDP-4-dehydrorhamnose reductase